MELPQIDNLEDLFVGDVPMLDVRAPVEYKHGAFPNTQNLPLMNDDERRLVGIEYKVRGQQKAIELGHQLVSGDIKEQRVNNWAQFIARNPNGVLYCFRGGLRSRISQQWIYEKTGFEIPRVRGGYKALRRFLIDTLDDAGSNQSLLVVSGRTGIGKTILLNQLKSKIDLEGVYHHRGSAFGGHATPQPSQIDIENALAVEFLKLRRQEAVETVVEDESASIGSRKLPENLLNNMRRSPIVVLEADLDTRVDIVYDEYIVNSLAEHRKQFGSEPGFFTWRAQLLDALNRIKRRLGGDRHRTLEQLMLEAFQAQQSSNDLEAHKQWIALLLGDYYDPMYDYQLAKKVDRVVFRGDRKAVLDYLKEREIR